MARSSRRRLAITVVVGLGVVDAVGIYLVQHKLGKPVEIGAREMAIANAPLAEPIAIRANGELKPTPALAVSAVAPRPAPAPEAQRTARADLPAPARAVASVAIAAARRQARQTAPVTIGHLADVEKPVVRAMAPRRSAAAGPRAENLRIHEQRIPARAVRVERMPAQADAFSAAFSGSGEELRLPEPAYGAPETQPQASVELPALELTVSQIQTDPAAAPETEIPAAPPATATGSDEVQPKS